MVMVTDDALALRDLAGALAESEDIEIVGEASNAVEAVDQVTAHSPDVVIVDLHLPHISGLETARILRDRSYPGAIIALSDDAQQLEAALESGAVGYLTRHSAADEVVGMVRQVLEGEFAFGADIMGTKEGMRTALRYITGQVASPAPARSTDAPTRAEQPEQVVAGTPVGADDVDTEPPGALEQAAVAPASTQNDEELELRDLLEEVNLTTAIPETDRDEQITADVDMVISPPVDTATVLKLYQWLQGVAYADVNEVVGSWTGDTVVKVTLRRPVPLVRMLAELPEVAAVDEEPYSNAGDGTPEEEILAELARERNRPTRIRLALKAD